MRCGVGRILVAVLLSAVPFCAARAQTEPDLGTAADFAVLGGTVVTCTGATITGDVGINTGTVGTCPTPGTIHNGDLAAHQAYADFRTAYRALALVSCGVDKTGSTLGGETLAPGVYCFTGAATLAGTLTLDPGINANPVWIFKVGTSGTGALTSTGFSVVKTGGGGECNDNVFWWIAEASTLTDSGFIGTILAGTDITMTRGSLHGRVLATGAVTLTGPSSVGGLALQPATLPSGWLFNDYSQPEPVMASGGTGPYTYSIASGSLPTGLTLDTSTGMMISGTPTMAGIYTFVVCAVDSKGFAGSRSYSITITDPTAAGVFASSNAWITNGKVTATWQSNVEAGVAQYQVHISKRADRGFAPVDSTVTAPKGNNSSYLVTFRLPQSLRNARTIYVKVQDLDMDGQIFWSTVSVIQRNDVSRRPPGKQTVPLRR